MNAIRSLAVLLIAISSVWSIRSEDGIGFIKCEINGVTNVFSVSPRAVDMPANGLVLHAFTDVRREAAMLSLTIQAPRLGAFSLRTTTNLTMFYSRSMFSSSLKDHFDARSDIPGTSIELSIDKLGQVGETVEGRFSGTVATSLGLNSVSITNGSFRLVRTNAIEQIRGSKSTQPVAPPNAGSRRE